MIIINFSKFSYALSFKPPKCYPFGLGFFFSFFPFETERPNVKLPQMSGLCFVTVAVSCLCSFVFNFTLFLFKFDPLFISVPFLNIEPLSWRKKSIISFLRQFVKFKLKLLNEILYFECQQLLFFIQNSVNREWVTTRCQQCFIGKVSGYNQMLLKCFYIGCFFIFILIILF